MQHVPINGANITLAAGQDEYTTIVGLKLDNTPAINVSTGKTYNAGPSITIALQASPEDVTCLLNGGLLYLRVLGEGFPPVALWAE